jgi:hypothetical protein
MKQALQKNRACLVLAIVVLAACSRDPAKQKAAFLASGEKYAKASKYQEAVRSLQQALSAGPDFPYAASAKTALHQIAKGTP